jgi:hypothetical protein
MNPGIDALRTHRAFLAAAVAFAVVVAVLAVVGLAHLLGWSAPVAPTPMSVAAPGNQVAGSAAELGLAPGETLVAPANPDARPAPLMPRYSSPDPPPPAPSSTDDDVQTPAQASPKPAARREPAPAQPRAPSFARGDPHPSSPLDTWPNPAPCERCGEVVAITTWPDMAEVRVRFEDGATRTLRSPTPSRWRIGERVRLEHGRLVRD